MTEAIAITIIEIGLMAVGGLWFGLSFGLGLWLSGTRMVIAIVEKKEREDG